MANGNSDLSKSMERQRDLQTELGAMLDRFRIAGMTAAEILDVLSGEAEIWEHRRSREIDQEFQQLPGDPHERPHPSLGGLAPAGELLGSAEDVT